MIMNSSHEKIVETLIIVSYKTLSIIPSHSAL